MMAGGLLKQGELLQAPTPTLPRSTGGGSKGGKGWR